MAKGVGLIGNFKGKVGNTVGYSLKDSNNKQTQGIRVYQPVVRNPKTYAQAEQRMKLAPINATYRALKMIVDRGQEGLAYGNKSRLAWLKDSLKGFEGGYFVKGADITYPAILPITKGSLPLPFDMSTAYKTARITNLNIEEQASYTVGDVSTAIVAQYPSIENGDQLTFVNIAHQTGGMVVAFESFVVDTTSTEPLSDKFELMMGSLNFNNPIDEAVAWTIIVSRESSNGQHLRSTSTLVQDTVYPEDIMSPAAKEAAIVSYMSQGANTDWAEESLMQ